MTLTVVPKPSLSEEQKQKSLELLERVRADIESGAAASVVILVCCADGHWLPLFTGSRDFSRDIGQLEIIKQEWIQEYLAEDND